MVSINVENMGASKEVYAKQHRANLLQTRLWSEVFSIDRKFLGFDNSDQFLLVF